MSEATIIEKGGDVISKLIGKLDRLKFSNIIDNTNTITICASCMTVLAGMSIIISYTKYTQLESMRKKNESIDANIKFIHLYQQTGGQQIVSKLTVISNKMLETVEQNNKIISLLKANNDLLLLIFDSKLKEEANSKSKESC